MTRSELSSDGKCLQETKKKIIFNHCSRVLKSCETISEIMLAFAQNYLITVMALNGHVELEICIPSE